jgi:hypothetical protein
MAQRIGGELKVQGKRVLSAIWTMKARGKKREKIRKMEERKVSW